MKYWNKLQVLDWLKYELECYVDIFNANEITGFSLVEIDENCLKNDFGYC